MSLWSATDDRVLTLPSGRLVRGRGLQAHPEMTPDPDFGVYLLHAPVEGATWQHRWVDWPDFGVPTDPEDADLALAEAWRRAADERVEVACMGGLGRTGTALACLTILDGLPAADAIAYVRAHYEHGAIETPGQAAYVADFAARHQQPHPA
ncbi:protein-tyrosine phosphatase family protein [Flexivirga oryzae]|uniref:Protein-tyrosine phosphatase n=1 Tax=Flexivirga oryzae TaxID=1794944 RepID=A0A839MZ85_9MICO|nr:protein-tyrosine phosphatase family protein [Flexivirga oryzae]MBB2890728.1 protein-tyrosine phosphatase [Flexivirga oryzae]